MRASEAVADVVHQASRRAASCESVPTTDPLRNRHALARWARHHGSVAGAAPISDREAQILADLGAHLTNAQIATRLHLSVRTVESHVSSLLRKLGAPDRRGPNAASRPRR